MLGGPRIRGRRLQLRWVYPSDPHFVGRPEGRRLSSLPHLGDTGARAEWFNRSRGEVFQPVPRNTPRTSKGSVSRGPAGRARGRLSQAETPPLHPSPVVRSSPGPEHRRRGHACSRREGHCQRSRGRHPGAEGRRRPALSPAPGFVAGYWTRKEGSDQGLSMVVFESEDAANAAAERIQSMAPEAVNVD